MRTTRFVVLLFLLSSSALCLAQGAADKVRQAVQDAGKGKCSDVLSTMVKYACNQQADKMQAMLKSVGGLKDVTFQGIEKTPGGPAEVYEARHENGKMVWLVVVAPDGKLSTFWTPGPQ